VHADGANRADSAEHDVRAALTQVDCGVSRVFRLMGRTAARQPRCLQHLQREQRAQHDADLRCVVAECRTGFESTVVESRRAARLLSLRGKGGGT
jgi:hypothetical protein